VIEVEGLIKYFGSVRAIDDVSFKVERGEVVAFLGPNAAGKTTTMRILTCFFPPTSGNVRVAGFDVIKDSLEVRRRIGYFLERVPLYPDMSVFRFLNFVSEVKGVDKRERTRHIAKVMDDCGLAEVSGKLIGNLSKGYRQRCGIAQALIHDPEVLILDEPTIGLDPEQVIEIRELVKNLAGRRTVLLSTHILSEASMICQRVIIINEGRIVASGSPDELTTELQRSSRISAQIKGPRDRVIERLEKIRGVISVEARGLVSPNVFQYLIESRKDLDVRAKVSSTVHKNDWGLLEMRQVGMTLEEIFVKVVSGER